MSDQIESEFKLRALQPIEVAAVDAVLLELDVRCRHRERRQHVDTYLDDDAGSLRRLGVGLRLRASASTRRLNCKMRGAIEGSLHVRRELEAPWPHEQLPQRAADLPDELRDALQPSLLERPLHPVQALHVTREVRVLVEDGADVCELAVDAVEARANRRTATFQEVELEVLDDVAASERVAHELRERLPVEFARDDKPTFAAALLGLDRRRVDTAAPTPDGTASLPVAQAAPRDVCAGLAAIRRGCAELDGDDAPERLRQLAAEVRRTRSLVRAFAPLWAEETTSRMLGHLGEVERTLGSLRDLDTVLELLPSALDALPPQLRATSEPAAGWIRRQRAAAGAELREQLQRGPLLAAIEALEHAALEPDPRSPIAAAAALELAPTLLHEATSELREQVDAIPEELPTEPLHRLRCAAAHARALAEHFAGLAGTDFDKSRRAIARVERRAGEACDHEVASERLLGWVHAAAAEHRDGAWLAATLGGLATAHAEEARATRARARRALQKLNRPKVWRRFPGS